MRDVVTECGDVETTPAMAFSSPAKACIRKGARG